MSNNFETEFRNINVDLDGCEVSKGSYYWLYPERYEIDLKRFTILCETEIQKELDYAEGYESHIERARRIKKEKKSNGSLGTKCVFLTLQTFQNRMQDLDSMVLFCSRIQYLYHNCMWCIEAGKVPLPDCNLHIHLLGQIKNSRKHKDAVCREWSKLFPTDLRSADFWNLRQHRDCPEMPSYEQWFNEKLEYFEDEKKGAHQNSIDLGARGGQGFSTAL
jgi:hypothetical protein